TLVFALSCTRNISIVIRLLRLDNLNASRDSCSLSDLLPVMSLRLSSISFIRRSPDCPIPTNMAINTANAMPNLSDDMGFVAWKDAGLNPYGNTVIVNADFLAKNKPLIAAFVKVTQKAFAACVATPKPCVQALIDANGALQFDNEMQNWELVEV